MIYIDRDGFDRQHYNFEYVRRKFLGEVGCCWYLMSPQCRSPEWAVLSAASRSKTRISISFVSMVPMKEHPRKTSTFISIAGA